MKKSLWLCLALAATIGCAANKSRLKLGQTEQGEVVEAEGLAPYNDKDLIGTKKASLTDAQKNAVEKAVGVFVSGRTMVEKAVAIENNILARTEGYIKKYDILSETRDGEFYKTKIRALVALKDLEADLKSYSLLSQPQLQRPRVSVHLTELINKEEIDDHVAENALRQSLVDQGFISVSDANMRDAEVLIDGQASSFPFQSEGLGGFVSYRARLSVQATKPGTKEVILSETKEASGLGGNETLAGFKSLESVGQLVGSEMATKLIALWSHGGNMLVTVEDVPTFTDVDRIRKHLQSQPGVKDLMLRMYDEKMAQFELQIGTMKPEELAASLQASQSLPLTVISAKNQTLQLKFEKK